MPTLHMPSLCLSYASPFVMPRTKRMESSTGASYPSTDADNTLTDTKCVFANLYKRVAMPTVTSSTAHDIRPIGSVKGTSWVQLQSVELVELVELTDILNLNVTEGMAMAQYNGNHGFHK